MAENLDNLTFDGAVLGSPESSGLSASPVDLAHPGAVGASLVNPNGGDLAHVSAPSESLGTRAETPANVPDSPIVPQRRVEIDG